MSKPKETPKRDAVTFNVTPADRQIAEALQAKLGVAALTEIYRMGLRALAAKEGVTL